MNDQTQHLPRDLVPEDGEYVGLCNQSRHCPGSHTRNPKAPVPKAQVGRSHNPLVAASRRVTVASGVRHSLLSVIPNHRKIVHVRLGVEWS